MDMAQRYSAFAASAELHEINQRFLANMASATSSPQAPLAIELLHRFMDEVLDSYFLGPMELIQLNNMGQKIVSAGVNAIRKTSKVAISKVLGKLSNEDIRPLSEYIGSIIYTSEPGAKHPAYVAVPISEQLDQRLSSAIANGRANGAQTVTDEFAEALCELINESIVQYFEKPVSLMKLGYIMEKFARVAMESGRAASQTVVRKVAKTMNEKELLSFFVFAESIVKEMPPREG